MAEQPEIIQIIEGCKRGKRSSQKKLYQHFYSYGMTVCLHYSANREEAQEILNDGFMKIFNKIDRYDDKYAFKSWLRRILINCAIDYYRRQEKHRHTANIIPINEPHIPNEAIAKLSLDDVMYLVQQLTPAYRLVFNLYVVEGYNHREIAEKLGISEGTSKSNLAKARGKLRKMVKKLYPEQYKAYGNE